MKINSFTNSNHKANFYGWSPKKKTHRSQLEAMSSIVSDLSVKRIAVSGHSYPDPDSIGSCFSMAYLLNKKTGRPVDVFIFGSLPKKFAYLQDKNLINVICLKEDDKELDKKYGAYDLAVSVDTSSRNLMNQNYYKDIFQNARFTFKIDHHKPLANPDKEAEQRVNYATYNFVDSSSPSASELVMQMVKPFGLKPGELHENFNNAIYTGILGDTGGFRYASVPLPFADTSLLIKNGLNTQKVVKSMNIKTSKAITDILTTASGKVKHTDDGKIAYLFLDDELVEAVDKLGDSDLQYEAQSKLSNLAACLRDKAGVEFSILFSRRGEGMLYASARSSEKNIKDLAQSFGGGGHDKAAGFKVPHNDNIQQTIENILEAFENLL